VSVIRRRAQLRRTGPSWVEDLRQGKAPARGTPAWNAFLGWYFFLKPVDGLPPYDSDEGRALVARLPDETWSPT
jgi:hypothetical protein